MTPTERVLRRAGAVVLVALLAIVGWSWWRVRDPSIPWSLTLELGGTIDHYEDDALVVSTTTRGLRTIRLVAETVVTDPDAPATRAVLQPGRIVVARGDLPAWGRPIVARTIMVWGAGGDLTPRAR